MKSGFVIEVDWIPTFWTFLLNLNPKDLIAELVQNDLDQDATCTVISFGQDQIVSEGDPGLFIMRLSGAHILDSFPPV